RPVGAQTLAGSGERRVDDSVRVVGDRRAALAPGARLDDERAHGRRAEVEAQGTGLGHARYDAAWCRSSESSMSPQTLTRIPSARAMDAFRTSARVAVAASGA